MIHKSVIFLTSEMIMLTILTLTGIVVSVMVTVPLAIGFLPGLTYLTLVTKQKGILFHEQFKMAAKGINQVKEVIWLFILIGMTLPAWMLSDTIPQMVKLTLASISMNHFFVLCFVMSALLSMLLGTSVGTLSTIGIPLISTAQTVGFPLEITAGALVSGAFIGDRSSPLSSSHQLLSHTVEVPVQTQFKSMLPTLLVGIILSFLLFNVMDNTMHPSLIETSSTFPGLTQIPFLVFLPPVLLLSLVLVRVKIRYAFLTSILAAFVLAVVDGISIVHWLHSIWFGVEEFDSGVQNMLLLMLFIAMAGAYNGIIEELRIIQPWMDKWMGTTISLRGSTLKTVATTLGISLIACNQTLPIILTGRSFLSHWRQYLSSKELVRVMGDTTMVFPGLIPWSLLAILCSKVLGVPVWSYLPYSVFLWVLPIVTIVYSLIKNKTKPSWKNHGYPPKTNTPLRGEGKPRHNQ